MNWTCQKLALVGGSMLTALGILKCILYRDCLTKISSPAFSHSCKKIYEMVILLYLIQDWLYQRETGISETRACDEQRYGRNREIAFTVPLRPTVMRDLMQCPCLQRNLCCISKGTRKSGKLSYTENLEWFLFMKQVLTWVLLNQTYLWFQVEGGIDVEDLIYNFYQLMEDR